MWVTRDNVVWYFTRQGSLPESMSYAQGSIVTGLWTQSGMHLMRLLQLWDEMAMRDRNPLFVLASGGVYVDIDELRLDADVVVQTQALESEPRVRRSAGAVGRVDCSFPDGLHVAHPSLLHGRPTMAQSLTATGVYNLAAEALIYRCVETRGCLPAPTGTLCYGAINRWTRANWTSHTNS